MVRVKVWVGFLKDFCENNEQPMVAYNMGGKFEVPAGKKLTDW